MQRPDSASSLLAFAHALADDTDPIALGHFSGELTITAKPDRTLVTQADTEVETRLRERIGQAYPSHGILGEEYGSEPGEGDVRWILDPIDGTHNYVRGIPVWATLIAVERAGEVLAGVVSAPALGLRWSAARGEGAHTRVNGRERPIHVSSVGALSESQLVFSACARWRRPATGRPSGRPSHERGAIGDSATSGATCSWPRDLPRRCSSMAPGSGISPRRR